MAAKVPPTLKGIASYIKIANENAARDPVVYYWCLYYAVQTGMQIDRTSPDALTFLTGLLGTLEAVKKQLVGNEAVNSEIVGQAHLEQFAFKLFTYADGREKAGDVDSKVVQCFNTAGHVLDVLSLFGELDENIASTKKYAKWKATQIFQCLKSGTPYSPSAGELDDLAPPPPTGFGGSSGGGGGGMYLPPPAASLPPPSGGGAGGNVGLGFDDIFSAPGVPPVPAARTAPPPAEHSYGSGYGGGSTHSLPPPSLPSHGSMPTVSSTHSFNSVLTPHHNTPEPAQTPYTPGSIGPEKINEAKKFCKWALSAMDYDDIPSTIDNLRKALAIVEKR